jgi:hypothetical protein
LKCASWYERPGARRGPHPERRTNGKPGVGSRSLWDAAAVSIVARLEESDPLLPQPPVMGTAASGPATLKLKLSSRYSETDAASWLS